MGLLSKVILKIAMKQAAKETEKAKHQLFNELDINPVFNELDSTEVRENCKNSLLEVLDMLIQTALDEFHQENCTRAEIRILKNCKCSVFNDGKGIDGNILESTSFSVMESMYNNDDYANNILKSMKNIQHDAITSEPKFIDNLRKATLSCSYFEIISQRDGYKYIKLYKNCAFQPSKFKKSGKTNKTGLTIIFAETINTLQKETFGYEEILGFAETTAKENPQFEILVVDERNNLQKQFKY